MSNFLQSLGGGQPTASPPANNAGSGLFGLPVATNANLLGLTGNLPMGLGGTSTTPTTLSSQMQDAQGLVHHVSSLLDGAHLNEDEVAGFRSTLALCRTLVNRLRVSQLQNAQQLHRGAAGSNTGGLDATKTQVSAFLTST
jgi:hypothetical protein